jgi:3-dehydroquinate dehydratase-2
MKDPTLLILNGPGLPDPDAHGNKRGNLTLEQIRDECSALCDELRMGLEFRQADDQDELFRWIAQDSDHFDALIINPAGHVKAGTVDADTYVPAITMMARQNKPVIEIHLTNIFRESAELTTPLQGPEGGIGFICGLGLQGYLLAIKACAKRLQA